MTKWVDLYNVSAEYVSDVIDVASDFNYYITNFSHIYENNDGNITLEVRVSIDNGTNWTDWIDINTAYFPLFNSDFSLNQAKIQYRVLFDLSNHINGISPVFKSFGFDFTGTFKFENLGDVTCKPELWITKTNGSGDITLTNETNGMSLELNNLNNNETVYVDCENEDIESSLPMTYRYNDHNNVFIEFNIGENILSGGGSYSLDIRYQFKTLQG